MRKMNGMKGIIGLVAVLILVMIMSPLSSITVRAEEPIAEPVEVSVESGENVLGAASYKVGDIIKFGHYEQDGNTANGKEEIEWQVLKVESDRALVISKYCLDCKPYNTERINITWENCTLRKWLNNDFQNAAFTKAEQAKIPTVNLVNKNNPYTGTAGGNNTNDRIFCLSVEEMESYFGKYSWYNSESMWGYNQNLICDVTQYTIDNGAYTSTITVDDYNRKLKDYGYTSDVIGRHGAYWWLRSPGFNSNDACVVSRNGYAGASYGGYVTHSYIAVRPALFLNLISNPQSINLNKTSATIYYGDSLTLTASITPVDADKTVTWTSSNPAVASVSGGAVKTKGVAGKTTITAKTVNGLTASCEVTVLAENNPSNPFADVKSGGWEYDAASYVYNNGYMTGKGTLAGKVLFSPNTAINRSQFVQTLYNVEGKPAVTYKQKFSDVSESDWYAKPVTWAEQNGIVAGNANGTFGVNGSATREQLALMFYKYAQYKGYDVSVKSGSKSVSEFPDAGKVSGWATQALNWALSRGIMSGTGSGNLNPKGSATRVQCATMLRNFMNAYKDAAVLKLIQEDEALGEALAPEELPEELPEALPEEMAEEVQKENSEKTSEEVSGDIVEEKSEVIPEAVTEEMSEEGLEEIPEETPKNVSEENLEEDSEMASENSSM